MISFQIALSKTIDCPFWNRFIGNNNSLQSKRHETTTSSAPQIFQKYEHVSYFNSFTIF